MSQSRRQRKQSPTSSLSPTQQGDALSPASDPVSKIAGLGWEWALILAAGAFLLYFNSFDNPFQFDDFHSIRENPHIKDSGKWLAFFSHPEYFSGIENVRMYRPLLMLVNAMNYRLAGVDPSGWHLVNIAIHGAAAAVLFLILGALPSLELLLPGPWSRRGAALGASALFLAHPVASETVNYISARSSGLAALLTLLSLLGYLVWRLGSLEAGGPPLGAGARVGALVASALLFAASLGVKEEAITLVALVPAVELLLIPARRDRARPYGVLALYAAIALGYLVLRRSLLSVTFSDTPIRPGWINLLTQTQALVYYIKILFIPTGLNTSRWLAEETTLADPSVLAASLLLSALVVVAFLLRRRQPVVSFAIAWYFITLSPTSSFIPLNQIMTERRLYLPLVGFSLLAVWACGALLQRAQRLRWPPVAPAMLGVTLALMSLLVWKRNAVWASDLSLWSDIARKAPGFYINRMGLAKALKDANRFDEAVVEYQEALRLKPDFAEASNNLANLYKEMGRRDEAIKQYEKALALRPDYAMGINNLASLYAEEGRLDEAASMFQKGIEANPNFWANYVNLAKIDQKRAAPEAALERYERALKLNPELTLRPEIYGEAIRCALQTGATQRAYQLLESGYEAAGWAPDKGDRLIAIYSETRGPDGKLDYAGLVKLRSRLAQHHPNLWQNWAGLAAAEEALGHTHEAVGHLKRALASGAVSPWREAIAQSLSRLENQPSTGESP